MENMNDNILVFVAVFSFILLLVITKIRNPHNKKIRTQVIIKGYFKKQYCPKCSSLMTKSWKKLILYSGKRAEGWLKYLKFDCPECGYSTTNKDFFT